MRKKPEARKEYNSMRFAGVLAENLGCECANCGSTDNIEYHHIVPVALGGTNRLTNIVPLCSRCHKAAHGSHHISHYTNNCKGGRKSKVPDEEAFKAYDFWLGGYIGNKKLKQLLNLSRSTQPNTTRQYDRYLSARGIRSIRSYFDVGMTLSCDNFTEGKIVGYVEYEDGKKRNIYFHDNGMNDDVEYDFQIHHPKEEKVTCTWGEMKSRICVSTNEGYLRLIAQQEKR